jgi:hypothetical protein
MNFNVSLLIFGFRIFGFRLGNELLSQRFRLLQNREGIGNLDTLPLR